MFEATFDPSKSPVLIGFLTKAIQSTESDTIYSGLFRIAGFNFKVTFDQGGAAISVVSSFFVIDETSHAPKQTKENPDTVSGEVEQQYSRKLKQFCYSDIIEGAKKKGRIRTDTNTTPAVNFLEEARWGLKNSKFPKPSDSGARRPKFPINKAERTTSPYPLLNDDKPTSTVPLSSSADLLQGHKLPEQASTQEIETISQYTQQLSRQASTPEETPNLVFPSPITLQPNQKSAPSKVASPHPSGVKTMLTEQQKQQLEKIKLRESTPSAQQQMKRTLL
ncbi:hypothetical protein [Parashewanella tropica]|uniref:hypothetical protein n=1 Tax=Parashewanella tropica TaxID=2547970 RepID=UPI001059395A|nr:hypothetical protein [Parashewanella tropica]